MLDLFFLEFKISYSFVLTYGGIIVQIFKIFMVY